MTPMIVEHPLLQHKISILCLYVDLNRCFHIRSCRTAGSML